MKDTINLVKLPPEVFRSILVKAVKLRGLRWALRLRLVCKRFSTEVEQAIFASHLADDATHECSSRFWSGYVSHRAIVDFDCDSPFNLVRRVAMEFCKRDGKPVSDNTSLIACIMKLAPLAADFHSYDYHRHYASATYEEDTFDTHMLVAASYLNDVALVEEILAKKRGPFGFSTLFGDPVRVSANAGNVEVLQLVLPRHVPNEVLSSALYGAISSHDPSAITYLAEKYKHYALFAYRDAGSANWYWTTPAKNVSVYKAVKSRVGWDETTVLRFLSAAIEVNSLKMFQTVYHDMYVAKALTGLTINSRPDLSSAALLLTAAKYADREMVAHLLDFGSDPDEEEEASRTPLQIAALRGHLGVVKELLARGASPNLGVPSPLMCAYVLEYPEMMDHLEGEGAVYAVGDAAWLFEMMGDDGNVPTKCLL